MIINPPREKWAQISTNGVITNVETWSGWRSGVYDDKGDSSILRNPTEAEILGDAIARALAASRMIHPDKLGPFFDLKNLAQRQKEREEDLMAARRVEHYSKK
jgi:CDI immunity protein